jgi:hypothetical protein
VALYDSTDPRDRADRRERADQADPMEPIEKKDPTEAIEQADPTEPIERTDPFDPMERNELSDHNDHVDVAAPPLPTPPYCRKATPSGRGDQVAAVASKRDRYISSISGSW